MHLERLGWSMKSEVNYLGSLFSAYTAGDDARFAQLATTLIQDLTARNRHSEAQFLQHALERNSTPSERNPVALQSLPRNRRDGEALVTFITRPIQNERVVLRPETRTAVDRLLLEQKRRKLLEKFGFHPKGKILFWGPPGCGKTLTACFIGTELGLPVGLVRLSALVTSYVGETSANLQRVFALASQSPMVLLLDEVDALAKNRDDRNDVGELKRVVNSLLQAFDSFNSGKSLMIAASNHQYMLDEAVWRRFDDIIEFSLPSQTERVELLRRLLSGVVFDGQYSEAARLMTLLSYADIELLVTESIKTMILEEREAVTMLDLMKTVQDFRKKRKRAQKKS